MLKPIILNIIFIFVSLSCSILRMDKSDTLHAEKGKLVDIKKYPEINTSVILGKVELPESIVKNQQPVVIVAYPAEPQSAKKTGTEHFVILDRTDEFMLYLPQGDYFLYALFDLNNDYIYEENETIGVYGKPDIIHLSENEIKNNINLKITSLDYEGTNFPTGFSTKYNYESIEYCTRNGQKRKIYSEIFSYENARIGWWHPSLFMKAFGANIYLTQDYNPEKIPVLFIHGAQGSPYDFSYFFVRLRNSNFQPLFFYYPSGMRLQMLSELLYLKIKELNSQYKFKKLIIVAHSMGGLVSRAMITDYYDGFFADMENESIHENFIKMFISFATPWSGFKSASTAIKTSPYILPSWVDVSAHSMFIKMNLKKKLPENIDYYLFYGKWDKTSEGRALDSRVYSEAKEILGYNADHNSILSEKEIIDKFELILKDNLNLSQN